MKRSLWEKSLSNISQVNLAGISPEFELGIDFNNERFSDQEGRYGFYRGEIPWGCHRNRQSSRLARVSKI